MTFSCFRSSFLVISIADLYLVDGFYIRGCVLCEKKWEVNLLNKSQKLGENGFVHELFRERKREIFLLSKKTDFLVFINCSGM